MSSHQESTLIDLLISKDMEAFSFFYDKYAPAIYGIICKEIDNEEKAKEILTDVFINFSKRLNDRDSIKDGLFICLYKITTEMIHSCKMDRQEPPEN